MLRNTMTVLMMLSLLVGVAAGAGGCNKEKREERKRQKEALKQQKLEEKQQKDREKTSKKDPLAPQNKFEASEDPPFTAETRFAAGQLAESQGNFDNAISQYQAALKLNPNNRDVMFRLAAVYTQTKRYNEAIAEWQRYIKVTNNSALAYNNLALTYEAARRPAEAEQTYKAAIERDPKEPTIRNNYGRMLARQGRWDEAITQLSTVLKPAEVYYNLGAICEETGKREEAKAYYRKALELDPNLRDARARLAVLK